MCFGSMTALQEDSKSRCLTGIPQQVYRYTKWCPCISTSEIQDEAHTSLFFYACVSSSACGEAPVPQSKEVPTIMCTIIEISIETHDPGQTVVALRRDGESLHVLPRRKHDHANFSFHNRKVSIADLTNFSTSSPMTMIGFPSRIPRKHVATSTWRAGEGSAFQTIRTTSCTHHVFSSKSII